MISAKNVKYSVMGNVYIIKCVGGSMYASGHPGTAGTKSVLIRVDAHVIDKIVKL